jgi:hypothetical protein
MGKNKKEISKKEKLTMKLDMLNENVKKALEQRSKFVNENIKYFAEFKIGEKVYNCITGKIGICIEHYIYNFDKFGFDLSFKCDCTIQEPAGSRFYDNTSRYCGEHPWISYNDFKNKTDKYIKKLEIISGYLGYK